MKEQSLAMLEGIKRLYIFHLSEGRLRPLRERVENNILTLLISEKSQVLEAEIFVPCFTYLILHTIKNSFWIWHLPYVVHVQK